MAYNQTGRTERRVTGAEAAAAATIAAREARRRSAMPPASKPKSPEAAAPKKASRPDRSASFLPRLRLLPVVIFVAGLMLTVRVGDIWVALQGERGRITITSNAEAQANKDTATSPLPAAQSKALEATKADDEKTPLDPVLFSRSEIELLQELSKRRKELDSREQVVIQREGLLTAAEVRIERQLAVLEKVKAEIDGLIKKYDEQEEKEMKSLVMIYEKMKPKEAARIFDQLEMDVLLQVIDRMKSTKTAPVLAAMRPARAKELTMRIAERRKVPVSN